MTISNFQGDIQAPSSEWRKSLRNPLKITCLKKNLKDSNLIKEEFHAYYQHGGGRSRYYTNNHVIIVEPKQTLGNLCSK